MDIVALVMMIMLGIVILYVPVFLIGDTRKYNRSVTRQREGKGSCLQKAKSNIFR